MHDLRAGENNSFLSFQKGDLIMLEQDSGEVVMNAGWCFGECARTGQRGDFPAEYVYVLPTIIKPPPDILVCCISENLRFCCLNRWLFCCACELK